MEYYINTEICIGCGLCAELVPNFFTIGDYYARLLEQPKTAADILLFEELLRDCPAEAIEKKG